MSAGTLFIVSAPSGAGKTSLVRALVDTLRGVGVSISHTTRPRRAHEREGAHYHFVSQATFADMVAAGQFLEHARVFDHHYGTSRAVAEGQLAQGLDVILEIDWQGAEQVRRQIADCVSIFILPPSRAVLEQRLRARAQDSRTTIARRMQAASAEMRHFPDFDYLIINDEFAHALDALKVVVLAQRQRLAIQARTNRDLLRQLLESSG